MSDINSEELNFKTIFSFRSLSLTLLGICFAVFAIKGFMIPNHFLDGGLLGISILIHEFYHISVSIPLVLLNLPFVYIGYLKISKNFAASSLIAVILLGFVMHVLPVPEVTNDHFLTAIFGGVFVGLGIGFVIRGGGVIDGLEVIAAYTNKSIGLSTAEIIMTINTTLFLIIAFYLGIEKAMYSIVTFYTALKTSNYVVDGFEKLISLTIIAPDSEKVKSLIVNDFKKAVTVYKGERGNLPGSYGIKQDCDIIVAVVTRIEVHKIKKAIRSADPKAFMYVQNINEVGGGIVSKRSNH
ncbi:YitT family protein [Aestuariibaculum marinum]|uniref:YitT family protein n=1 Tax=Aestuariibaculum marinum TaxID=2683592 RepID=A0A8J6U5I3_9FLAO|nr:YitT family protein [Aestuariibaculum marinum]MBD0824907.1 YitT family protein [Aestuariibaculum marinum]